MTAGGWKILGDWSSTVIATAKPPVPDSDSDSAADAAHRGQLEPEQYVGAGVGWGGLATEPRSLRAPHVNTGLSRPLDPPTPQGDLPHQEKVGL